MSRRPSFRGTRPTRTGECWPRARSRSTAAFSGSPQTWTRPCRQLAGRCRATARWSRRCGRRLVLPRWSRANPSRRCIARRSSAAGARHPIVVGDRLDTDVEGAEAGSAATACSCSPASPPRRLLVAPERQRPTTSRRLGGLLLAHPNRRGSGRGALRCLVGDPRRGRSDIARGDPAQRSIDRRRAGCAAGAVRGRWTWSGDGRGCGSTGGRRRQRGCRARPGVMASDLCRSAQHGTAPVGGSSL